MTAITAQRSAGAETRRRADLEVEGRKIVCEGSWPRMARIFDEVWLDLPPLENPEILLVLLQDAGLNADIFTFAQALPDTVPVYDSYPMEWDNLAVANTTNFTAWWESLPQESRKNTRKAQKRGVTVRPVDFNDDLVRSIKAIYDETPIRQGRRFWHYGKDFETVKRENSSYLDRAQFIGAFLNGELIGFIKMVYVGSTARIMQILSLNRHYDKHTTNALLTAAVEQCSKKPAAHLIYGQYVYGNKRNSSVTEFKRRNSFNEVLLPRYYIPLTIKGRAALSAGVHRGITGMLPEPMLNFLLDTRTFVNERVLSRFRNTGAAVNR